MSDERLRELERRWRECGSVEDEAAYLRERVRVGELTKERLELAAYCGEPGAQLAADLRLDVPLDWRSWALGLERWGAWVGLHAYLAAYRNVTLPIYLSDQSLASSSYPAWATQFIARIQAYLGNPTPKELEAACEWDARCGPIFTLPAKKLAVLYSKDSTALRSAVEKQLATLALGHTCAFGEIQQP